MEGRGRVQFKFTRPKFSKFVLGFLLKKSFNPLNEITLKKRLLVRYSSLLIFGCAVLRELYTCTGGRGVCVGESESQGGGHR